MNEIEKRTVSQCSSSDYCRGWNDAVDKINQQRDSMRCENCKHQLGSVQESAKFCFMCSERLKSYFEPKEKTE